MAPRNTRAAAATPPRAVTAEVPPPSAEIRLNGSLDRVDPDGTLEGWCWSPDEPEVKRPVVVLIDNTEVARFLADQERADLHAAGVGNGHHAFLYCLEPEATPPGRTATVSLRDARSGLPIGRPVAVQWPGVAGGATAAAAEPETAPALHGHLDRVSRDGWVTGWCWYPDRPEEHVELAVLVDDDRVATIRAANFRPDLQQAGIGDGTHGFSTALPYSALADKGTLRVTVQDARTGRNLSDPVIVRLGRMAAAEDRINDLERQIRLLRGQIDELAQVGRARDEDRAARELFGTVASFFADLAEGRPGRAQEFGASGLAGALADVASRYAPITLALAEHAAATICVAATAGFEAIYRCLAALHDVGADRTTDIVLLDDETCGASAALLPAVVRNLRYMRLHDGSGMVAGRNQVSQVARGAFVAFLSPEARVTPGWLDEILATFEREPEAAIVGSRLVRGDGLLEHAYLLATEDGRLRDPGHLASAEICQHRFMRRVDAVAGLAFAARRDALLAVGGFSPLYRRFGHAVADLCARLRAARMAVLYQPVATALWVEHGAYSGDGAAPDLSLPDEETLRLRGELRHEGWPAGPVTSRFVGHALVIDDDLPRPDRDAGSIATFEQMLLLRRLGWHVTFCPVHALTVDPRQAEVLARNGIEVAGPPQFGSVTQYLQAEGEGLGLVHLYRYENTAMLLDRVRELAPDAKLVFATADLHFLREERRAELAGKALPDAVREEELRCMRAADATIVTSDYELELLRRDVDPEKLVLLRWITRAQPVSRGFVDRQNICFVGNFRHPPNLDGIQWFLAEVFPMLRRTLPGLRLLLAGSDMPPYMADLAGSGVEVLGWVEDLAELFGRVRLSVAPLRFGAGFKGKVATSLAHGLPVVGSSISLEGTGLSDGDGVAVADDPPAFAEAVVRLHEDAALWTEQSARGLERVTALYSPEAALEIWRRLLFRLERPAEA
jgi:glycosyltransferase involved in cell wall biosynthesis